MRLTAPPFGRHVVAYPNPPAPDPYRVVLLPQLGGFEGFVSVPIRPEVDDLSVSEGPLISKGPCESDACVPRLRTDSVDGDEALACPDDLLQLDCQVLERLQPAPRCPSEDRKSTRLNS